jgi:ATP-binding cassette subfamily B protein
MTGAVSQLGAWRTALRAGPIHRRTLAVMWLLTLASAGFALLQPWPVQVVIDHAVGGVPGPGWLTSLRARLPGAGSAGGLAAWAGIATVLIFMLDAWVDVRLTMRWVREGQGAVYRLGQAVFAHLLRRAPTFHARTPVGDSVGRVTGDSWCVYNAASAVLFAPLQAAVVGVGAAVVMFRINAWLAAMALALTPAVVFLTLRLGAAAREAKGVERQSESRLESHVHQTFAGLAVVQAFAQEQRAQAAFGSLTSETLTAQRRSARLAALSGAGASLIATLALGIVLLVGSREVIAGRLTVGTLLVFIAYQGTLNSQLSSLASAWTSAKGMTASAERVARVLDEPPEIRGGTLACSAATGAFGARLVFEDVRFAYEPGREVLRGVNLVLEPGRTLALVGPSGAGKSTLAALVPRLLDPTSGRVTLNGADLRSLDLASLREQVGVLFQEPMLLSGTVADNIRLGRPEAGDSQVQDAARLAGAHEFIARLPAVYETELGHRGCTLSGGERQRLALARALVRAAPILVLDEPTASLDPASERALLLALERARTGRTTLIVAHRLSTIRSADAIAVLDQGQVREFGTHSELLALGGLYSRMWRLQSGASRTSPGVAHA